jgi:hypothetical protein
MIHDRARLKDYHLREINRGLKIAIENFSAIPKTRFLYIELTSEKSLFNICRSRAPRDIFDDLISFYSKMQDFANEVNEKYDDDDISNRSINLQIWETIVRETLPSKTLKFVRNHFNYRKSNFSIC